MVVTPTSAATTSVGRRWAQYLVDKGFVKQGDFVWMPVEVPGATYGCEEEQGIKTVFEPLGITYEITEATLDQAEIITRMSNYLTANRSKIKAIIGLGDLVTGNIKRVFDQVGVKPGEIPVVGWGNSLDTTQEVLDGYVNAAKWQDPQATSYLALSLAVMAAGGIPPDSTSSPGRSTKRTRPRPISRSCRVRGAGNWAVPTSLLQSLVAQARIRTVCAARGRNDRFHRTITSVPVAAQHQQFLAFTLELGMIALAMTLLMTSGEFDLSVGSVFGFAPIVMWTLLQCSITSLAIGFLIAMRLRWSSVSSTACSLPG